MLRYGWLFVSLAVPVVAGAAPDRARLRQAAARELSALGGVAAWPAHRLRPTMIRGLAIETRGVDDAERARGFLSRHPGLYGGSGSTLALRDVQATHTSRIVRFEHRHRGLPVFGATVVVVLDRGGRVRAVSSEMEPITKLSSVDPRITAVEAVRAAQRQLLRAEGRGEAPPRAGAERPRTLRAEGRGEAPPRAGAERPRTLRAEGRGEAPPRAGAERPRTLRAEGRGEAPPRAGAERPRTLRADGAWARLGVLPGAGGAARLVYRVALPLTMDRRVRWHLVDAATGAYVGWRRATPEVRR